MPCSWVRYLGERLRASIVSIKRGQVHTAVCGLGSVYIQGELSSVPCWNMGLLDKL